MACLPLRAKIYAAALPVAAAVCFGWWWSAWPATAGGPSSARLPLQPEQLLLAALFTVLTALAALFPLRLSPGYLVTVDTAGHFAALLLFGPPVAMLSAGVATAAANLALATRGQRDRWNVAFNSGQVPLAVGVAAGVLYGPPGRHIPSLQPGGAAFPLDGSASALAVAAAGAVLYATTSLAVAVAVGLHRSQNPLAIVARTWRTGWPEAGALVLGGLLTALLTQEHPWAVVVTALFTALIYVSLQRSLRLMAREQEARAELERAVHIRGEFLAVASHELRTPVASLRGYAQLLLRQCARPGGPDPNTFQRGLNTIDRQSERLTRLVAQLLDISRLQAGNLVVERQLTDLSHLAESVVASMQGLTTLPASLLELRAEQPVWALVDPLRLEQVLVNLLDNAIKYAVGPGPIEVEVARELLPAKAGEPTVQQVARLTVRDRAAAIPEAERERVFERFLQLGGSRSVGGMGLGLYVSRQIVEAHGGRIVIETPADGEGNCFIVVLPAVDAETLPNPLPVLAAHAAPAPERVGSVLGT